MTAGPPENANPVAFEPLVGSNAPEVARERVLEHFGDQGSYDSWVATVTIEEIHQTEVAELRARHGAEMQALLDRQAAELTPPA